MDSKQLVKIIKVIVEAEVAKKQEHFLTKTFPKILEEEVTRRLNILLESKGKANVKPTRVATRVVEEVDPFEMANQILQQERQQPKKEFTKNPVINEILNQTKPFSKEQRVAGPAGVGTRSVLDQFQQQPIQESYIPNYMDAEPDIDGTINMGSSLGAGGVEAMRAQMAAKMGYGDMGGPTPTRGGLGVTTGLPGLDRILNRDNSELVKKFKR